MRTPCARCARGCSTGSRARVACRCPSAAAIGRQPSGDPRDEDYPALRQAASFGTTAIPPLRRFAPAVGMTGDAVSNRTVVTLAAAVALVVGPQAFAQAEPPETATPRLRVTINDGWRYAPGALDGAESPTFSDSAWTRVEIPHTWNDDDA